MERRFDYRRFSPEPLQAMMALEKYIASCGLNHKFVHLLKLRASQINGCAFCIDMHSKDARAGGETEQRLYELDAWRETPFYSERERAAMSLATSRLESSFGPPALSAASRILAKCSTVSMLWNADRRSLPQVTAPWLASSRAS